MGCGGKKDSGAAKVREKIAVRQNHLFCAKEGYKEEILFMGYLCCIERGLEEGKHSRT